MSTEGRQVTAHAPGPGSGLVGVVDDFDADIGLGTVTTEDGNRFGFHCTAVADGSRQIEVGLAVRFDVSAAGPGRWEAFGLAPQV